MKFFIANISEAAGALVLVDDENNLFSATSIVEAEESFKDTFGRMLEIGKIFHEDGDTYFFATVENGVEKPLETLPAGWSFKAFEDLSVENCDDFEAIKIGLEKLGWL